MRLRYGDFEELEYRDLCVNKQINKVNAAEEVYKHTGEKIGSIDDPDYWNSSIYYIEISETGVEEVEEGDIDYWTRVWSIEYKNAFLNIHAGESW